MQKSLTFANSSKELPQQYTLKSLFHKLQEMHRCVSSCAPTTLEILKCPHILMMLLFPSFLRYLATVTLSKSQGKTWTCQNQNTETLKSLHTRKAQRISVGKVDSATMWCKKNNIRSPYQRKVNVPETLFLAQL